MEVKHQSDRPASATHIRRVRLIAWGVMLALAVLQAWAARFTLSPDGMSYLDMSDSVGTGRWSGIVNAYWSPLYPALIGVLRLVLRPDAYWESAVVHLLNALLFAASIAGFEYFLAPLTVLSERWGRPELGTVRGRVAVYAFFCVFSLTLTPVTTPTPDLAVSTAVFFALGALLRIGTVEAPVVSAEAWRAPVVLGLSLAFGALAKSFLVPWSVVCFVVLALATRRRDGWSPAIRALSSWAVVVVPWLIILSVHTGRPTFGETGRLAYVWAMDFDNSPSNEAMPTSTLAPAADSILPGVAIMPNATGTNPVWYDPARWYGAQRLEWNPVLAATTFGRYLGGYLTAFAPLVVLLWLATWVADRDTRRIAWRRGWIVIAPSLIALGAYALVLVTTRYIAPFVIAGTLVIWLALPWPSRLRPLPAALALVLACLAILAAPRSSSVLASQGSIFAAVLAAWIFRRPSATATVIIGIVAGLAVRLLMQEVPASTDAFTFALAAGFGAVAAGTIRRHQARDFSQFVRTGLIVTAVVVLGLASAEKYRLSLSQVSVAKSYGVDNLTWAMANDLRDRGVTPGMRVAIVGSPFEAYWARSARVQVMAVVPKSQFAGFWAMPRPRREALIGELAKAGVQAVVVTEGPPNLDRVDGAWVPTSFGGWVRVLGVNGPR